MTRKIAILAVGRMYYGPQNARVRVLSLDAGSAVIQHPVSLNTETWPLSRLHDFADASPLRTYHREGLDGLERRTKIALEDEGATIMFKDEKTRLEHRIGAAEWAKWRAKAE